MQVIDARGLSCPQPVLLAKKMTDSNLYYTFKVLVDDMAAFENISALAKSFNLTVSHEKMVDHIEMTLLK